MRLTQRLYHGLGIILFLLMNAVVTEYLFIFVSVVAQSMALP